MCRFSNVVGGTVNAGFVVHLVPTATWYHLVPLVMMRIESQDKVDT